MAAEPRQTLRFIRLIFSVLWYVSLILTPVLFIAISAVDWPWYLTHVKLDPSSDDFKIHRVGSGIPLLHHFGDDDFQRDPEKADRRIALEATAIVSIFPPNRAYAVLYSAMMGIDLLWIMYILYKLRKLFGDMRSGTPFTRANVQRLRFIGKLIFWGTLLFSVLDCALQNYLASLVTTKGLVIRTSWLPGWEYLFFGLLLIALSELFLHGADLEEERTLTV